MNTRHEKAPGGSGKRREELLQVRLARIEKETFEEAANLSGLALSAWVRERLRSAAMRELQAAARPVPFLDTAKE